jgi:hypothetical protein
MNYKRIKLEENSKINDIGSEVYQFEDGVEIGIVGSASTEDGCCICGKSYDGCGIQSNVKDKHELDCCNSCICEDCLEKIITLYKDGKFGFIK